MHPGLRGPGHQLLHLVPAGDQHTAPAATGQQRPHLRVGTGVVQHDQHPAVGEHAPVQRHPFLQVAGDLLARHPQGTQETAQHVVRGDRLVVLVVPAQVREELAVGEVLGGAERPAHREAALSYARGAGDQADGGGARLAGPGQEAVQRGQFLGPAGERRYVRGQFGGNGGRGRHRRGAGRGTGRGGLGPLHHRGRGGQRGVVAQDGVVQFLQVRARFDAQLLDELAVRVPVGLHRVRPAARTVLGQHQVVPRAFPQRVLAHHRGQPRDEFLVLTQLQVGEDGVVVGVEAVLLQPLRLVLDGRPAHPREGGSAPQSERLGVGLGGFGEQPAPGVLLGAAHEFGETQ
ncbi:hypothetical protein STENM36S_05154 [Streptomyces tendae]